MTTTDTKPEDLLNTTKHNVLRTDMHVDLLLTKTNDTTKIQTEEEFHHKRLTDETEIQTNRGTMKDPDTEDRTIPMKTITMKEDNTTKIDVLTDTMTAIVDHIIEMTETTEMRETFTRTDITTDDETVRRTAEDGIMITFLRYDTPHKMNVKQKTGTNLPLCHTSNILHNNNVSSTHNKLHRRLESGNKLAK